MSGRPSGFGQEARLAGNSAQTAQNGRNRSMPAEIGSAGAVISVGDKRFLQAAFAVGQRVHVKNWGTVPRPSGSGQGISNGTVIAVLMDLQIHHFAYLVKLDEVTPTSDGHEALFYWNELEPMDEG